MKVQYRKSFLRDLRKLKGSPVYNKIYQFVFTFLPEVDRLEDVKGIKAMKGHPNRYRIRIGNYRVGIEINNDNLEVMRVLHRGEFYRYFP